MEKETKIVHKQVFKLAMKTLEPRLKVVFDDHVLWFWSLNLVSTIATISNKLPVDQTSAQEATNVENNMRHE